MSTKKSASRSTVLGTLPPPRRKPAVDLPTVKEIEIDVREALEQLKKDKPVVQHVTEELRRERLLIVRRVMGLDPNHHGPGRRRRPAALEKKLEQAAWRWMHAFLHEAKPQLTPIETQKLHTSFRRAYARKLEHLIESMATRAAYDDAAAVFEQLTGRKMPKYDKRRRIVRGYY